MDERFYQLRLSGRDWGRNAKPVQAGAASGAAGGAFVVCRRPWGRRSNVPPFDTLLTKDGGHSQVNTSLT